MYVLFPGRAWQLRNPLTSEELHRLPGKNRDGQPRTWRTSSESGGSEELYFVASRAPIAELEDLVARLPEVTADDEPTYPRLDPDLRDAVLRGIDGTAPARAASEMPAGTTIASVVQALSPESGAFVRRLRLKSGD